MRLLAAICSLLVLAVLGASGSASAAVDCANPKKAGANMEESAFHGLEASTELIQKQKYSEAIAALQKVADAGNIYEKAVAYYNMGSASVGFQLGVQEQSVVILFMTDEALAKFRASKGWKAGVDGSVAIAQFGAGESIDTATAQKPIIGFVFNNKGLMYNLSIEGAKITRIKK